MPVGQLGSSLVDVNGVTEALGVLGFYICVLGLFSYFVKERLYLSEALIAMSVGIAVGPIEESNDLVFVITRIVLGIQVLFTGINLPKAYLKTSARGLLTLLFPVMTVAWMLSSLFVWALIPGITFLESLVVGAALAPTDPVLAASIVKGRFAEKYVAKNVRNILAAESAANDGLGYPFIYIAFLLIEASSHQHTVGWAIWHWIVQTLIYQIALSCLLGAIIGYIARRTLRIAEQHRFIDHESFLAYGIGLAFITLAIVGVIGSDDILACFIAGNSFTWDDWFRKEVESHSFQDVIDLLLDSAVFILFGTLMPWSTFGDSAIGLSPWRLVVLGALILLFRRIPAVLATSKFIPEIEGWKEALFVGHFGPIGVGAVYYLELSLRELPQERIRLSKVMGPIIYFMVLTSILVHGSTVPTLKLGPHVYQRTRSIQFSRNSTMRTAPTATDGTLPGLTNLASCNPSQRDLSIKAQDSSPADRPIDELRHQQRSLQFDIAS